MCDNSASDVRSTARGRDCSSSTRRWLARAVRAACGQRRGYSIACERGRGVTEPPVRKLTAACRVQVKARRVLDLRGVGVPRPPEHRPGDPRGVRVWRVGVFGALPPRPGRSQMLDQEPSRLVRWLLEPQAEPAWSRSSQPWSAIPRAEHDRPPRRRLVVSRDDPAVGMLELRPPRPHLGPPAETRS